MTALLPSVGLVHKPPARMVTAAAEGDGGAAGGRGKIEWPAAEEEKIDIGERIGPPDSVLSAVQTMEASPSVNRGGLKYLRSPPAFVESPLTLDGAATGAGWRRS